MKQVEAILLEVDPFTGGVGGQQDADGMRRRVAVECFLDLLPFFQRGRALVDGQPLAGTRCGLNERFQVPTDISQSVVVLGEDQDAVRVQPRPVAEPRGVGSSMCRSMYSKSFFNFSSGEWRARSAVVIISSRSFISRAKFG